MRKGSVNVNAADDLRELPAYAINEAAHYLQIPQSTLRSWVLGRYYPIAPPTRRTPGKRPEPSETSKGFAEPIISLPEQDGNRLSFVNLVEAHVLGAIRRHHEIPLQKVRKALEYLKKQFPSKYPLAEHRFETDGINLFVQKYGRLINISQKGQLAIRRLLEAHLRRIEWDEKGFPLKLYPFTRKQELEDPKVIVIDPYVSFGRPVLAGTGIPTAIMAERWRAGESIDDLADDYGLDRLKIEEAIWCELKLEAA